MKNTIVKVTNNDIKVGTVCSINVFEDKIDIQVELETLIEINSMEQIYISWTITDDHRKPVSVEILNRAGYTDIDDIELTQDLRNEIIQAIDIHINKYGLKQY